jgi:Tat protein translocase TatC
MSFLDHLEELRDRLFKALGAVTLGFIAGWFLVERFGVVALLKAPIAPFLPDGKLVVLSPTEPLWIVLKLSFITGCVLASPVVLWQVWAFLSPALYARERKVVVPALVVGAFLFLLGAAGAFLFVVPQALEVLFSFQNESLATMITFEKYYDFVVQLMLAMGISFELPLVIIILSAVGAVSPAGLSRFRRVAIVLALIAGAILSPGADIFSMLMLTIPLILLYEVGYLGSIVIWRRKLRASATASLLLIGALALWPTGPLAAQDTIRPPARPLRPLIDRAARDSARTVRDTSDTSRVRAGVPVDSARARRLGLPTAPSREFPAMDSVMERLMRREGYESTRFQADTTTLFVSEKRIDLRGRAMTERAGSILEAREIGYQEANCVLEARGDPKVFDQGTVMRGEGLRYNTCEKRAVVSEALTNFQEGGVEWFMRGTLSQDSTARRIYASGSEITSCDLPVSHYHFAARQTKWISKTVLVARPAVLYVRDVPLLWLPFIFQDGRPGRRSGILVPSFGINDIVRPNSTYARSVTNMGYYWAPTDYFDATVRADWYAGRQWETGMGIGYRWLDRFIDGRANVSRLARDNGSSTFQIDWQHRQQFSLTSNLNVDVHYESNAEVRGAGSIRTENLASATSSARYTKRFPWGVVDLGARRSQDLSSGEISQNLPTASFTPNPIALSNSLTWSPGVSFTQTRNLNVRNSGYVVVRPDGTVDTIGTRFDSRTMNLSLRTPLDVAGFTLDNTVEVSDMFTDRSDSVTRREPDLSTPDPNDSVTVTTRLPGDFESGIDWNTNFRLPSVLRGTWQVTPSIRIANAVQGEPYLIRNRRTDGEYVAQTKRLSFALGAAPTFYGMFPGFGPVSKIRHAVSPSLSWSYAPETEIPLEFAQAITPRGQALRRTVIASQLMSLGLQQTIEAKGRPAPGDTSLTPQLRKFKIIGISTSQVGYDFEQAKEPGQTGWVTPVLNNSLSSDLVPGFSVSLTHDLWRGPVGTDSAVFDPALTGMSASFSLSGQTFRSLGRLFGLGADTSTSRTTTQEPAQAGPLLPGQGRPGSFERFDQVERTPRGGFTSQFTFTLNRDRPDLVERRPDQVALAFSTGFSPTAFWSVQWRSLYNFTSDRFESQEVRLERDLHEWRASFTFRQNPNGNFGFYFNIALLDLPDIKFDYDQQTLPR